MATTDDTALQEQIARSLALTDDYDGCFERLDGTDPEVTLSTDEEDAEWWRKRAAAVLPIIRAEVAKARVEARVEAGAEALREAADKMPRQREADYLEELADEIEKEQNHG